jgi:hypothetical protein
LATMPSVRAMSLETRTVVSDGLLSTTRVICASVSFVEAIYVDQVLWPSTLVSSGKMPGLLLRTADCVDCAYPNP